MPALALPKAGLPALAPFGDGQILEGDCLVHGTPSRLRTFQRSLLLSRDIWRCLTARRGRAYRYWYRPGVSIMRRLDLGESYGETTGLMTRIVDQQSRHQLSSMREDTREHVINR
jgi:hypothetical protein